MKYITILLLSFISFSCQETEVKCEFKPEPILNKEWKGISQYSFNVEGKKSIETASFDNGVRLELFQEVCNYSNQEFHFYIKTNEEMKNQPDAIWIAEAVKQFYYMSSLDKQVRMIASYGDFIRQDADKLQLGEKYQTSSGNSILIDRIIGSGETKLIVKLS